MAKTTTTSSGRDQQFPPSAASAPAAPAKPEESKRDRFCRLADARLAKAVKAIRALCPLSARSSYEYDSEDATILLRELRSAVADVESAYRGVRVAPVGLFAGRRQMTAATQAS